MRRGSISRSGGSSRSISRSSSRSYRSYHRRGRRYSAEEELKMWGYIIAFGIIILITYGYFALTWSMAGSVGGDTTTEISLEPRQNMMIDKSNFWDESSELFLTGGGIDAYYFDTEPQLSEIVTITIHDTLVATDNNAGYLYFAANTGSTLEGGFDVSSSIFGNTFGTIYLYYADDVDLDEGDFGNEIARFGDDELIDFEFDESGHYFLATSFSGSDQKRYSLDMTLQTLNYNLEGASEVIEQVTKIEHDLNGADVIILHNGGIHTEDARLVIYSTFSVGTVFFVIQLTVLTLGIYGVRKLSSKPKPRRSTVKSNKEGYIQRPEPKHCKTCDETIMSTFEYCTNCGTYLR